MSQQNRRKVLTKSPLSFRFLSVLTILLFASVSTRAAGEVDPTYNPVPAIEAGTALSGNLVFQPDGKLIVFGSVAANNLFFQRLNTDGTVDASFNCAICNSLFVTGVVVQPDSKILLSGSLTGDGNASAIIYRLNPDGSQDSSFVYPFSQNGGSVFSSASVRAVQPDGKILFVLSQSFAASSGSDLRRLNTDGSFDNSFTPITTGFFRANAGYFSRILPLANGKILVGATSGSAIGGTTGSITRYNSDFSRDTSFEPPTFANSADNRSSVDGFELLPDGSLIVVGRFTSVNGVARINLVKLQPAGNVDLSFAPQVEFSLGEYPNGIKLLSNGQILISTANRFLRLNANGTVDNTFTPPIILSNIGSWIVDRENRIVLVGQFGRNRRYARLNQDGTLDETFNFEQLAPGSVLAIAVQPDGKAIVSGGFTKMNGVTRNRLARLNPDGTVDTSFDPRIGFDGIVRAIVLQPDGKILAGGSFTSYNGERRLKLARLNTDGSLDNGFTANVPKGDIYALALQPDGKILVGGDIFNINDTTRRAIARLNPNGTVDPTFNAGLVSGLITSIIVQPDSKITIGGTFTGIGGFNRANFVRLNADGTVDAEFNAGNIASVRLIQMLANGKYIAVTGLNKIIRLNNNGTTDNTFQSPEFTVTSGDTSATVNAILIEPDGSIVVGGEFTSVNNLSRSRITRLRPDGRVDASFVPAGANRRILALAFQTEGKILVGGDFTNIGNVARTGLARINSTPFRNVTPFDFDGDGRADIAVFRQSNSFWYILNSSNNSFAPVKFGSSGDLTAPADYDGDGRTDIAVFRPTGVGDPAKAYFYIQQSRTGTIRAEQFGRQGDVPVSGDWDGDGAADLAVYRDGSTTGGQNFFFYRPSSQSSSDFRAIAWGAAGDKPVAGDYDGDGKLDAAVFRPSIAYWFVLRSSNNQFVQRQYGISTDVPTPADYDGDGITNFAVFRPSTGTWYTSIDPLINYGAIRWGVATDVPIPADYDGDGRADVAVFRPDGGNWYVLRSASGFLGVQWGTNADKPAPAAYVP